MRGPDDGLFARPLWTWPDPVPFQLSRQAPGAQFAINALDLRQWTISARSDCVAACAVGLGEGAPTLDLRVLGVALVRREDQEGEGGCR